MRSQKQIDWIMDLFNAGGYEVRSWNHGDPAYFMEWIPVTMGTVVMYSTFQINICDFRKQEEFV